MNKRAKALAKFLNNPDSMKHADIHTLLVEYEFICKRISGSHYFYQNTKLPADLSIPVHGGDCKLVYKKHAAKLLRQINNYDV